MDDAELRPLLERTAVGDRQAFQTLYEKASPRLFAVSVRVLQDRAEAEDALQDAFIKIWRYAERFPVSGVRAQTWMIAIVRNTAIDKLRA
ncbi:MAG: sigma factor, partial [Pseudomonadota bacterium]